MATKSILKNINIKQRKHLKRFADALDKAEKFRGKYVPMSRGVVEAKGEEIKRLFPPVLDGVSWTEMRQ